MPLYQYIGLPMVNSTGYNLTVQSLCSSMQCAGTQNTATNLST